MKKIPSLLVASLSALLAASGTAQTQSPSGSPGKPFLWQIGKADDGYSEFAGSPGDRSGHGSQSGSGNPSGNGNSSRRGNLFEKDGLFVVGRSIAGKDWPFAQPGPDDAWAGHRAHTYSILFGLRSAPASGTCRLTVKLIDVGPRDVNLLVSVNDHTYHQTLPEGSGRAIHGDLTKGKRFSFSIDIPAESLHAGDNRIELTTESGSWFLYDWIGFEMPGNPKLQAIKPSITLASGKGLPFITEQDGHSYQPARLTLLNTGDSADVTVKITGLPNQRLAVGTGRQQVEVLAPAVYQDSTVDFTVARGSRQILSGKIDLKPVRKMTIYILPHSHNDIGYTEIQTNVERKQMNNLLTGIEYARQTKDYPAGARFVWNLEGMYAADLFLHRMNADQKQAFLDAVKDGGVALNGMYLNTLTGLCRPEELLQLFRYSNELAAQCGTTIRSAMISDVPGYTWGTVSAMAQAGIRYFSAAPNYFDRIGDILVKWEDKPFWWVSPSGKEKVLVWIPYKGYALSHGMPDGLSKDFVDSYIDELKKKEFPYDISYIRWSGHGDNAVPDRSISDFVKDWSGKYSWPKFIISSTTTAFKAFEDRYGDQLPQEKGDWTGYWEDGAGSSALETAENRGSSSRLTQAEALWAMAAPGSFPADSFHRAWQHVILYSEHTWGADESVTRPLSQKTMEQWIIKKSYATMADTLSRALVLGALSRQSGAAQLHAVDIYNTNSWTRTDLVTLSAEMSSDGEVVKDADGRVLPSQRLSTGELAFVASGIPPFASRRYFISGSTSGAGASDLVQADSHSLDNGIVHVSIDAKTGAINSLRNSSIDNNFADSASGEGLNDYLFLNGSQLADLQRNGPITVTVKEKGPVLATLLIHSDAPGCTRLVRELRLVKGFDYVEVSNVLDKKPAELDPYPGEYSWANIHGKESLNIAFPFHVPGGEMKLDIPMAVMHPETDQIPGSCRNWLEVGSWADVSNKDLGVTWVTLDAPLVEVGGITATLLGGQSNPAIWRKKIEPTQKLYSWALNNHWETNYRAYQQGLITFRYALQPHKSFDAAASTRLATGLSQPLIVAPAVGEGLVKPRLQLSSSRVVVLTLRPAADGKAWLVTLYNPTQQTESTSLDWGGPVGATHYSNTSEQPSEPLNGPVTVGAQEVVTLRVEK
ncbi:MAG TPA: polysaccharide lyase family protein [Puia sp.]|nr:polysaccharide lyase family protein [Puia sp.]